MSTSQNILFCGGGTGGHYYPLMAIKQELDKSLNNKKMYYIGSKYGAVFAPQNMVRILLVVVLIFAATKRVIELIGLF